MIVFFNINKHSSNDFKINFLLFDYLENKEYSILFLNYFICSERSWQLEATNINFI